MNKEQLMELGLTEEQADKVLAKYVNMIPKLRFDEVNEEKKELKSQLIVDYQGEKMTMIEAAEKSHISYGALYARHRRGIRGEDLFVPVQDTGDSREVDYHGRILTLRELSDITGVNHNTLKSRWRAGKRGLELYK